ncbi:MAG: hypothetical protein AAF657_28545 [Acidobacteriota bacterium]
MDQAAVAAVDPQEVRHWTPADAEVWREAELGSDAATWAEDDCLLDNDLWLDEAAEGALSPSGLRRLDIRMP